MTPQIVSLRCPSCGGPVVSFKLAFGTQFSCDYCGSVSVLAEGNRRTVKTIGFSSIPSETMRSSTSQPPPPGKGFESNQRRYLVSLAIVVLGITLVAGVNLYNHIHEKEEIASRAFKKAALERQRVATEKAEMIRQEDATWTEAESRAIVEARKELARLPSTEEEYRGWYVRLARAAFSKPEQTPDTREILRIYMIQELLSSKLLQHKNNMHEAEQAREFYWQAVAERNLHLVNLVRARLQPDGIWQEFLLGEMILRASWRARGEEWRGFSGVDYISEEEMKVYRSVYERDKKGK